ncbi:MAG TPA: hypothetical protein VHU79_08190 [Sphingomicrobium sp.]|nr:hypothetical protein [Sphingomicrobium sp.]
MHSNANLKREARHQFIQDELKIKVTDEQSDARMKDLAQSVIKA